MLKDGLVGRDAAARFGLVTEASPEVRHVIAVWNMIGGRLRWTEVFAVADLHDGDAGLLLEGLPLIRDTVEAYDAERAGAGARK